MYLPIIRLTRMSTTSESLYTLAVNIILYLTSIRYRIVTLSIHVLQYYNAHLQSLISTCLVEFLPWVKLNIIYNALWPIAFKNVTKLTNTCRASSLKLKVRNMSWGYWEMLIFFEFLNIPTRNFVMNYSTLLLWTCLIQHQNVPYQSLQHRYLAVSLYNCTVLSFFLFVFWGEYIVFWSQFVQMEF